MDKLVYKLPKLLKLWALGVVRSKSILGSQITEV